MIVKDTRTGKNFFFIFSHQALRYDPNRTGGPRERIDCPECLHERGHILSECEQGSRRHPRMVHFSPMEAWRNWHTQET